MTGVAIMLFFILAHYTGETPYAIFQTLMGESSPGWFTMVWIVVMSFHDIHRYIKYLKEDK